MSPTIVTIGNSVTLICADNATYIATSPSEWSVVTDPPYGINYVRGAGGRGMGRSKPGKAIIGDDTPYDPSVLLRYNSVTIWGANHYCHRLPQHGSWSVWDKRGNGRGPDDSFADAEIVWTNYKTKTRVINYLWKGICQDGEKGEKRYHPTQKPIAVMEWCIKNFTPPSTTIIDPYMGAGSTGLAALRQGRPFVGVEIDPEHFETARARIQAEYDRTLGGGGEG